MLIQNQGCATGRVRGLTGPYGGSAKRESGGAWVRFLRALLRALATPAV